MPWETREVTAAGRLVTPGELRAQRVFQQNTTPERLSVGTWREYAEEHLADLIEEWPNAVHVLATQASSLAGGGWTVTPELLREWYERTWGPSVRGGEAA